MIRCLSNVEAVLVAGEVGAVSVVADAEAVSVVGAALGVSAVGAASVASLGNRNPVLRSYRLRR
jgi:hypothetical protein